MEALGIQGMSSDESDHTTGRGEPTYHNHKKSWCSPILIKWLHILDCLFLRYKGGHTMLQGGWPHYYLEGDGQLESADGMRGLPVVCYSAPATMEPFEFQFLKPVSITLNLIHSEWVQGWAFLLSQDLCYRVASCYDLLNQSIVLGCAHPEGDLS